MPFDVNAFISEMQGGFGKQAEAQTADAEAEGKAQDLEFKAQQNQLSLLQKLAQIFEIGKKSKKNADGTEQEPEPNPILEMLKSKMGGGDMGALGGAGMPQEYAPEAQPDPYSMGQGMPDMGNPQPQDIEGMMSGGYEQPPMSVGSGVGINDIVGNIANSSNAGAGMAQNDFMDSNVLEQYLQRYLRGEK